MRALVNKSIKPLRGNFFDRRRYRGLVLSINSFSPDNKLVLPTKRQCCVLDFGPILFDAFANDNVKAEVSTSDPFDFWLVEIAPKRSSLYKVLFLMLVSLGADFLDFMRGLKLRCIRFR
jgi:hypothetical protein